VYCDVCLRVHVCVCVCVSICEHICLELHRSVPIFVHVTYGRVLVIVWRRWDIRHVLPVLGMTSCLHIMARIGYLKKIYTQSDSSAGRHSFDTATNIQTGPPAAAPDRKRSLISTIALCVYSR